VRFYWKAESAVGGTKAGKAKILRSVAYPRVLDLYNYCSDSLKSSLNHGREMDAKLRAAEDAERLEGKKAEAEKSDKMVKGELTETAEEKEQQKVYGKAAKAKEKE